MIAEDYNTLTVAPDTFVTSTVTFTPVPGNPALAALAGQRLQIRLCALEDPSNHATDSYAAFDDVTLDFTPPVVSGGYASWKGDNAGDQDPDLDFDNDGVKNGVEYFMNAAAGFTANPALDGTNTITWPNGGNIPASAYGTGIGKQFVIQTSSDLSVWLDVDVGDLTTNSDGPDGSLTYTLTGASPRFVRLKVTPE